MTAVEYKLPVKWFSQLDSATHEAGRMCRSSSHAMLAHYLKPGCLVKGPHQQSDDNYLELIHKYGDTTETAPHIQVLRDLGIHASFHSNLGVSDVEEQIRSGIPVPVGILHHGVADDPWGGGHWVLIVGYTPTHFYVHDPAGELDLVNGGYHLTDNGQFRLYSKKNFCKRWECVKMANDRYKYVPGNGWGTIAFKA